MVSPFLLAIFVQDADYAPPLATAASAGARHGAAPGEAPGARFAQVVAGPDFAEPSVRAAMDELCAGIARAEALIARVLAEGGLPEQQIHADLHFDNVLVTDDGEVSAVLDFE